MKIAFKLLGIQIGSSMPKRLMISLRYFVRRSSLAATVCIEPSSLVTLPRPQHRRLPRQFPLIILLYHLLLMPLLKNPLHLFQGKVLVQMMRVKRMH